MRQTDARKQAYLLIYQYKFQPDSVEDLLNDYLAENKVGTKEEYIKRVVLGVIDKIEEIDGILNEYSREWTTERMSSVSLAALRLGVFEIMFCDDIPNPVSINEAVNIATEFEGEEAAPFVNGILGNLKKNLDK